jgi:hypothetical protein
MPQQISSPGRTRKAVIAVSVGAPPALLLVRAISHGSKSMRPWIVCLLGNRLSEVQPSLGLPRRICSGHNLTTGSSTLSGVALQTVERRVDEEFWNIML